MLDYVRSVPASEMWALAMATLQFGNLAKKFFSECKAVRSRAWSGKQRATAASQLHARIWAIIFNHFDGAVPQVEWIPSLTGRVSVGVLHIGDGSKLTLAQWTGNRLADQHARAAATAVRHPEETIKERRKTHKW